MFINKEVAMKYFTKEWYNKMQCTGMHILLRIDERCGKYSDELFTEIYNKKIEELEEIKKSGIQKNRSKEELQKNIDETVYEFRENVWKTIFKKYENVFSSAFDGYKASKENFRNKVCYEYAKNQSDVKHIDDLKARADVIFRKSPVVYDKIQPIEYVEIIDGGLFNFTVCIPIRFSAIVIFPF